MVKKSHEVATPPSPAPSPSPSPSPHHHPRRPATIAAPSTLALPCPSPPLTPSPRLLHFAPVTLPPLPTHNHFPPSPSPHPPPNHHRTWTTAVDGSDPTLKTLHRAYHRIARTNQHACDGQTQHRQSTDTAQTQHRHSTNRHAMTALAPSRWLVLVGTGWYWCGRCAGRLAVAVGGGGGVGVGVGGGKVGGAGSTSEWLVVVRACTAQTKRGRCGGWLVVVVGGGGGGGGGGRWLVLVAAVGGWWWQWVVRGGKRW